VLEEESASCNTRSMKHFGAVETMGSRTTPAGYGDRLSGTRCTSLLRMYIIARYGATCRCFIALSSFSLRCVSLLPFRIDSFPGLTAAGPSINLDERASLAQHLRISNGVRRSSYLVLHRTGHPTKIDARSLKTPFFPPTLLHHFSSKFNKK
jgi:hypothetical protein